jgi:hypothetical protein
MRGGASPESNDDTDVGCWALADGRLDQPRLGCSGGGGGDVGGGGLNVGIAGNELPVSRVVQPALRKEGWCGTGAGSLAFEVDGPRGTGGDTVDDDATVAHPDFLKPGCGGAKSDGVVDKEAHFLDSEGFVSTSIIVLRALSDEVERGAAGTAGGLTRGLGILIPFAAAIFLSCFSSRFRSFSFRLSTSSLGMSRTFACISLNRAL